MSLFLFRRLGRRCIDASSPSHLALACLERGIAALAHALLTRPKAHRFHTVPWPEHFQALRSEEHTSEVESLRHRVCRLLLEKKKSPPRLPRTASRRSGPTRSARSSAGPRTQCMGRPTTPPPRPPQGRLCDTARPRAPSHRPT